MNVLIYNPESLQPISNAAYSNPEDIPAENTYLEITEDDMDYCLEIIRDKKTGNVTYRRAEKIYPPEQVLLTQSAFRKRLTFDEKLWWDHFNDDDTLSPEEKKKVVTIMKDFHLSDRIDLQDHTLRQSLEYFALIGKLPEHRIDEILRIET